MIKYAQENIVPTEGSFPVKPVGVNTLKNWLKLGYKPKDIVNGGQMFQMNNQPEKGYRYFTKNEVEPLNEIEKEFVKKRYGDNQKVMGNGSKPTELSSTKPQENTPTKEEIMRKTLKKYKNIISIKVESTGFDFENDEVLRISIANMSGTIFHQIFKPHNKEEWKETEKYHGITPAMTKSAPYPEYVKDFIQEKLIDQADGITFYNASYNLGFLKKIGLNIPDEKVIDAQVLFKAHKPLLPNYSLGNAVKLYFTPKVYSDYADKKTNGIFDAYTTLGIFTKISHEIKKEIYYTKDIDLEEKDDREM